MREHTVKQGECLYTIAHEHRYEWKALWDHPKNADLKARRGDPFTLAPGDVVHIPDPEPARFTRATGATYRFRVKRDAAKLSLQLLDHEGMPRKDVPYEIEIEGQKIPGEHRTNGEGRLQHDIATTARRGRLRVLPAGRAAEEYDLMVGALDPIEEVSGKLRGVQGRLASLGFYDGPLDDTMNDDTIYALQSFQASRGLLPTGELSDETRNELTMAHGA
ncbi:Hypothetical protein A7982_05595 [Minicystis rosea]|nr:Hypothetical protein A7982_05595 [Minicystis rosea]